MDHLLRPSTYLSLRLWNLTGTMLVNLLVFWLALVYLSPLSYMVVTSFKDSNQLGDPKAPIWPARAVTYTYEGREYPVFQVPTENGLQQWALVTRRRTYAEFIDPAAPEAGLIRWDGSWRTLDQVYAPSLNLENFASLWRLIDFPRLVGNTFFVGLVSGLGVLLSSIAVAYGLSRFNLPGERLILLLLIATILIPEKITLIPTYYVFVRVLDWNGTYWPLIAPHFFGHAVFIFLLRQNFKSIPRDLDEAAMLDGAGPLRTLISVILPQTVPAVATVALLHFFYIWNETRLASLYLSTQPDLRTIGFGVQAYQSLLPTGHILQASALIVMLVPIIVLFLFQRVFLRDVVVTGVEK